MVSHFTEASAPPSPSKLGGLFMTVPGPASRSLGQGQRSYYPASRAFDEQSIVITSHSHTNSLIYVSYLQYLYMMVVLRQAAPSSSRIKTSETYPLSLYTSGAHRIFLRMHWWQSATP